MPANSECVIPVIPEETDSEDYASLPNNFLANISRIFNSTWTRYFISLVISIFVVMLIRPKMDPVYFLFVFLMSIIINTLMASTNGSNAGASLPPTVYPIPPHLGLDGVNLTNRSGGF